jgi:hypothetical protein
MTPLILDLGTNWRETNRNINIHTDDQEHRLTMTQDGIRIVSKLIKFVVQEWLTT